MEDPGHGIVGREGELARVRSFIGAGELDAAREVLHQELTEYERLGRYVVRAELLTYLVGVECRAGAWEVAARHAQEAYEIDVESGWVSGLGNTLFPRALVAARDDLARVGGATPPAGELTPTEQRIAQLVGEGKKNREVAEALFISVKTVEANLSRISTSSGSARARSSPAGSPPPPPRGPPPPRPTPDRWPRCRGFPPIPRRSPGPSLLPEADPTSLGARRTPPWSRRRNRAALRAALAAHRHRGGHGVRHGGRRDRRGRAHHGVRARRR